MGNIGLYGDVHMEICGNGNSNDILMSLPLQCEGPLRSIHTTTVTATFDLQTAAVVWTPALVDTMPICDFNNWRHQNNENCVVAIAASTSSMVNQAQ